MNIWPIYIPSRHRATVCKTAKLLDAEAIPYCLVVEPHDAPAYREVAWRHGRVEQLGQDHGGIVVARNGVLDLATREQAGWYWTLDDDIASFFRRENRKMVKCSAREALTESQRIITEHGGLVAMGALEYQQVAWSTAKDAVVNGYCEVVTAINIKRWASRGVRYDEYVRIKEDRDAVLQCLTRGLMSVRVQRYAFGVPKNGSNAGGCQDDYRRAEFERQQSERMVEKWGDICTFNRKPDGRPDVRIDWKRFKPEGG